MPRRPFHYDPARDYYALLGVLPSASAGEIQQAFRARAKQLHPDRNPDRQAWATAAFQAINEAYTVLSDPAQRREYDLLRWPHAAQAPPRPADTAHADRAWWEGFAAAPPPAWTQSPQPADPLGAIQMIVLLLRGPYGGILRVVLVLCLLLPLSYALINGYVTRVVATRPALTSSNCTDPGVQITSPGEGEAVAADFAVQGSADAPDFFRYVVEIAPVPAEGTPVWQTLAGPFSDPVRGGVLAVAPDPATRPAGAYLLRLVVFRHDGYTLAPCQRRIVYSP